jgi:hypothetical protein
VLNEQHPLASVAVSNDDDNYQTMSIKTLAKIFRQNETALSGLVADAIWCFKYMA